MKDFKFTHGLKEYTLKEGQVVLFSLSAIQNNSDRYIDPSIFDPKRHTKDGEVSRQPLGFGAGVRMCPGKSFGKLFVMATLINLVYNFEIKRPEVGRDAEFRLHTKAGSFIDDKICTVRLVSRDKLNIDK